MSQGETRHPMGRSSRRSPCRGGPSVPARTPPSRSPTHAVWCPRCPQDTPFQGKGGAKLHLGRGNCEKVLKVGQFNKPKHLSRTLYFWSFFGWREPPCHLFKPWAPPSHRRHRPEGRLGGGTQPTFGWARRWAPSQPSGGIQSCRRRGPGLKNAPVQASEPPQRRPVKWRPGCR